MADKKRGLPESFDLDVPDSVMDGPMQIGDYLDEEDLQLPESKPKRPTHTNNVAQNASREEKETDKEPLASSSPPPKKKRARQKNKRQTRQIQAAPIRKQINMTPETIRMVDELTEYVRTYGIQKDASASEFFHGLVLALYEAREHIDLGKVPARGRWGTPTAAAFPVALKNAFVSAIVEHTYAQQRG